MKILSKSIVLALIFIFLLSFSTVSASDNSIALDSIDDLDNNPNDINLNLSKESSLKDSNSLDDADSNCFTDLEQVILNSNETSISLEKDYSFNKMKDSESGIQINKSIAIDGKGHSLDGLGLSRIFNISNSDIVLRNINFINGFSNDFGGAIALESSNLNLINCSFKSNGANLGGGAIYALKSNLSIDDCSFSSNGAEDLYVSGGAIYAKSTAVEIKDSCFFNNSADEGGAIYLIYSDLNLDNSIFANNLARWYGGSIWSESVINANNCEFYNNKAGFKGGAIHSTIYTYERAAVSINNSRIFNNSAEYGGAISSSNYNYVNIDNCEIFSNNATYGAVLSRISRHEIRISNSRIYNNTALNGTVVHSFTAGLLEFKNDSIENNTGDVGTIFHIIGGRWVYEVHCHNFTFSNCRILDNKANKGLFYLLYGDLIINDSLITYKNGSYDEAIVYHLKHGLFIENNNWWGVDNPDFDVLVIKNESPGFDPSRIDENGAIIRASDNVPKSSNNNLTDGVVSNLANDNLTDDNEYNNSSIESINENDCTTTIIQIDNETFALTFRIDSIYPLCVEILKTSDGILQYKSDKGYFWQVYISDNGWAFGNGGLDSPYSCEKLEAFARIMSQKNAIVDELVNRIYSMKNDIALGHFLIKAPNGTYVAIDHFESGKVYMLEYGVLNPGEYIISPNNGNFYIKSNLSDLNITEKMDNISHYTIDIDLKRINDTSDYIFASRYLAAIDAYGITSRTFDFTYYLGENLTEKAKDKFVDIYIANDDGSLINTFNHSIYTKDVFFQDNYIIDENVPLIMNGMYLGRLNVSSEIIPMKTKIIASNMNILYNAGKYLTAKLTDIHGKALSNQEVFFKLNNKTYRRVTNAKGEFKLAIRLCPKTWSFTIVFNGNDEYLASSLKIKVVVKKANVKLTLPKKTFKLKTKVKQYAVTLKDNKGVLMKNVKLSLKFYGKTYTAKTNSKGQAIFKITNFYKKGTFTAKVTFKTNKYYNALTKSNKIIIKA